MHRYSQLSPISDDSYCSIMKAINTQTQQPVVIKKLKKKFYSWLDILNLKEIKTLKQLSHPLIQQLKELIFNNNSLYLVLEYYELNLFDYYQQQRQRGQVISDENVKSIMMQILTAVQYTHQNGFFHRDLSLQNIYLVQDDGNLQIKLGFFNTAKEISSKPPYTDYVTTRFIRSPEQLLKVSNYDSKIDMFALGCIYVELLYMSPLFNGNNEFDQLIQLCKILGTPSNHEWSDFGILTKRHNLKIKQDFTCQLKTYIPKLKNNQYQLIKGLLSFNPSSRLSAQEALQHNYFQEDRELMINVFNDNQMKEQTESDSDSDDKLSSDMRLKILAKNNMNKLPPI